MNPSTQLKLASLSGEQTSFKPTLMLVDDEERVLRSLRMLFARDYNIVMTTDAKSAIGMLRQEKVHVLISDQRMPDVTGVELLQQAREISPNTMRILLTGYADLSAIVGSINEGEVFRFINKPWDSEELRRIVAQAMQIALSTEGTSSVVDGNFQPVRHQAVEEKPVQAKVPATSAPPVKGKILILDSDPLIIQELMSIVRESYGAEYRPLHATTLEEAMALISSNNIALIVSDVTLGGQDIKPLIAMAKETYPEVVTIVITGTQGANLMYQLINQGQIYRYLSKPIRRVLVKRAIENGIRQHIALREMPKLRQRYQVESVKQEDNPDLVIKLRSFFNRFKKT